MRNFAFALMLTTFSFPLIGRADVVATNPERASAFSDLAQCNDALGRAETREALNGKPRILRGSLFNRAAGNTSHCEMVDGEPMIVVYPNQHHAPARSVPR
jgi:hypothetical protein